MSHWVVLTIPIPFSVTPIIRTCVRLVVSNNPQNPHTLITVSLLDNNVPFNITYLHTTMINNAHIAHLHQQAVRSVIQAESFTRSFQSSLRVSLVTSWKFCPGTNIVQRRRIERVFFAICPFLPSQVLSWYPHTISLRTLIPSLPYIDIILRPVSLLIPR